jgi:hypothetical protein
LAANDVRANTYILMTYDGTNWEAAPIGNAPSGGSSTITDNIWMAMGGQYQGGANGVTSGACMVATSNIPSASGSAAAQAVAGSTWAYPGMAFNHAGNLQYVYCNYRLHDAWTGAISLELNTTSGSASGNAYWLAAISCVTGAGNLSTFSYNTAVTAIGTYSGTANTLVQVPLASLTSTGCAAGNYMSIRIGRDGTQGTDTMSGSAYLTGVVLKVSHN